MKRNINLLILGLEIAAIVILHAFKMNNQPSNAETNSTIVKTTATTPGSTHYSLLSIK